MVRQMERWLGIYIHKVIFQASLMRRLRFPEASIPASMFWRPNQGRRRPDIGVGPFVQGETIRVPAKVVYDKC